MHTIFHRLEAAAYTFSLEHFAAAYRQGWLIIEKNMVLKILTNTLFNVINVTKLSRYQSYFK